MATFKTMVRTPRRDGFYAVYIRVWHNRRFGYINTGKVVTKNELDRKGEIKDPFVLQCCSQRIIEYSQRLLSKDIENWTVLQVVEFLNSTDEDLSFSQYARAYHDRMVDNGMARTARNYEMAYQSLERFAGTTNVKFSQLTSHFISGWQRSLAHTARAKEQYSICIRQIFKSAIAEYNDYDEDVIRIKTNPWIKCKIPKSDVPEKKAITAEECRKFFATPIPDNGLIKPLSEVGRDVAQMVLCLAGINTADLFDLRKKDYQDGLVCYCRHKTRKFRSDNAYIEMRVPPILESVFEKYMTEEDDEYLFNFHNRFCDLHSFNANVNTGIKQICKAAGVPKEDWYSVYTFRHSWATIAQNDCGASLSEVGFAMNHSQRETRITRGYVKPDFTPAWELNEKVVDFVFFSNATSRRVQLNNRKSKVFRLSPAHEAMGQVFLGGTVIAEVRDIGYSNVDEVINDVVKLIPEDLPPRTCVQVKITDLDKRESVVYEKVKGKSFS